MQQAVAGLAALLAPALLTWGRLPAGGQRRDYVFLVGVTADWDRLGQVLDNLLINADRFSPPGAGIRIEVGRDEGGPVWVRLSDSGPGVPRELRDRVFDRFVRASGDAQESRPAGTGLGLSIARGLIEAHGGWILLEETGGAGATFRFTLPSSPPS